jgi:hypothetical protein
MASHYFDALDEAARVAAEADKVHVCDVLGTRIVTVEARWVATLPEEGGLNTWSFLVVLIKASLDLSSHQGLLKDASGTEVDLSAAPVPGKYTWVLEGL